MQVILSDRFDEDLAEHYMTIFEHQPAAADRFAAAVALLLEALGEFPLHGRVWESSRPALSQIRMRKVPGYDVLIFYRIDQDRVFVSRALHGARGDLAEVLAEDE